MAYTRPLNRTSHAMVISVRASASTGSHHSVAPMAIRFGIASGAVTGRYDTICAAALSGRPTAANDAKYAATISAISGPATLCASSSREASDPSAPYTMAYRL